MIFVSLLINTDYEVSVTNLSFCQVIITSIISVSDLCELCRKQHISTLKQKHILQKHISHHTKWFLGD